MTNVDLNFRLKEFTVSLNTLTEEVVKLKGAIGINELWDNADMIGNWKISTRTLAFWRAEGLIDYVQVGGKIWYPREARENFIIKNQVKN